MDRHRILAGDCRASLEDLDAASVQCCVTSPPYWGLRSYLPDDDPDKAREIGTEETPELYVAHLLDAFRAVHRVLRDNGVLWLNLGDSYANDTKWGGSSGGKHAAGLHGQSGVGRQKRKTGLKSKDLVGIPWLVAMALRADGWYLRSDVIWSKPNGMPERVTDRPTSAHEYLFLLTKSPQYFYDADAIKEPTVDEGEEADRNKRSVWTIPIQPYPDAHFAVMPPTLVEPCILAGSRMGDVVLDPFSGAGTVGVVALQHSRRFIGCELSPQFVTLAEQRIRRDARQSLLFTPHGKVPV